MAHAHYASPVFAKGGPACGTDVALALANALRPTVGCLQHGKKQKPSKCGVDIALALARAFPPTLGYR